MVTCNAAADPAAPSATLPSASNPDDAAAHLGQGFHPPLPGRAQVPLPRSPRSAPAH